MIIVSQEKCCKRGFYFQVATTNGKVICRSKYYKTKQSCLKGIVTLDRIMSTETNLNGEPWPSKFKDETKNKK